MSVFKVPQWIRQLEDCKRELQQANSLKNLVDLKRKLIGLCDKLALQHRAMGLKLRNGLDDIVLDPGLVPNINTKRTQLINVLDAILQELSQVSTTIPNSQSLRQANQSNEPSGGTITNPQQSRDAFSSRETPLGQSTVINRQRADDFSRTELARQTPETHNDYQQLNNEVQLISEQLRDRDATISSLQSELDSSRNLFEIAEKESTSRGSDLQNCKRQIEQLQTQLHRVQSDLDEAQRAMIRGDRIDLRERLLEHSDLLPEETRGLLVGLLSILDEVESLALNDDWVEQNIDRIRAYVYSPIGVLPLLSINGMQSALFSDYYRIALLQYETHKTLNSLGLMVICPKRGDPFDRRYHDFSDKDLAWVDDESWDNRIETVRRIGFIIRGESVRTMVLKKALVRRCVYSSESLESDARNEILTRSQDNADGALQHTETNTEAAKISGTDMQSPQDAVEPAESDNHEDEKVQEMKPASAGTDNQEDTDDAMLDDILRGKKDTA